MREKKKISMINSVCISGVIGCFNKIKIILEKTKKKPEYSFYGHSIETYIETNAKYVLVWHANTCMRYYPFLILNTCGIISLEEKFYDFHSW